MAPQTFPSRVQRKVHADAASVGTTTAKNPKIRPHKRSTIRPKWFRSIRPVDVSDFQLTTQSPTTRKVSIEELQRKGDQEDLLSNWPGGKDTSLSSIVSLCVKTAKSSSSSTQTLVSPATSPRLFPRSASCAHASMKRRAPSKCLVGLLSHQTEKRNNSSVVTPGSFDDSIGSTGVWGHFVELQEESSSTLLGSGDSPRRRPSRRPILPLASEELEGFFLTVPDVDEAVDQLRNMSF